jgi:hypothetical protein
MTTETTPQREQNQPHNESDIRQFLAANPSPESILSLTPSAAMQTRFSALLAKQKLLAKHKQETLSPAETQELDDYFQLEHLVSLAKAQAYRDLNLP